MTPRVRLLLIANIAIFFVQLTVSGITDAFAFVPADALRRPWTIITYMFLHSPSGIMHIAFNMLALFFFGPRVEERLGSRDFTVLYFVSGVSGAILSMLLAPGAPIVGASAAIFGVMLAFAYFWPDAPIYIWGILPVPARILVLVTTLLTLYSGLRGSRGGIADFAHLGGYVGAFIYLRWLTRGNRGTQRATPRWTPPAPVPSPANGQLANWRAVDTRAVHEVNRDEVNRILDKINATGLESLSAQERMFLSNFVPRDDRPPVS